MGSCYLNVVYSNSYWFFIITKQLVIIILTIKKYIIIQ